jgi:hypothetical protein
MRKETVSKWHSQSDWKIENEICTNENDSIQIVKAFTCGYSGTVSMKPLRGGHLMKES